MNSTQNRRKLGSRFNTSLPWWLSRKEPTCQCSRHGFHIWPGKMPHAEEQQAREPQPLSMCSRAQELQLRKPHAPEPRVCYKRSCCNEKPTHPQLKTSPPAATREEPRQQQRSSRAKNKTKYSQETRLLLLVTHLTKSVYLRLFA